MADSVAMGRTKTYEFLRALAWPTIHAVLPVKYYNLENLPKEKPFVIITNHVHALDPMIAAFPVKKDQCFFVGKKELGKNGLFRKFLYNMHCILVDRHNFDMEAMRTCMRVVKEGNVLVIFPEGTRHHEGQMEQIESGTAMIVLRAKVPLVPMYIDKPLKFLRRVNAYIGEPIPYDDLLAEGVNKDTCEKLNERIREVYRKMIADAEKKN